MTVVEVHTSKTKITHLSVPPVQTIAPTTPNKDEGTEDVTKGYEREVKMVVRRMDSVENRMADENSKIKQNGMVKTKQIFLFCFQASCS